MTTYSFSCCAAFAQCCGGKGGRQEVVCGVCGVWCAFFLRGLAPDVVPSCVTRLWSRCVIDLKSSFLHGQIQFVRAVSLLGFLSRCDVEHAGSGEYGEIVGVFYLVQFRVSCSVDYEESHFF